jgi:PRTRC genetic system protein E
MTMTDTTLEASAGNSAPIDSVEEDLIDDEGDEEAIEPVALAATHALEPAPIVLPSPDPIAITGLFAGLSLLAEENGAPLLLAIAKMKDGEIRVSVQPPVKKDEPNGSALPIIVCGTPDELDRHILEALGSYVPARNYAVASVDAVAQSIKNAADAARAKSAKKPTTTVAGSSITQESTKTASARGANGAAPAAPVPPAPVVKKGFGLVTVVAAPAGASIRVTDSKGKTHTPESGHELTCVEGRATITVSQSGYGTKLQAVTVSPTPQTITIELPPNAGLFAAVDPPVAATPEAAADAGAALQTDSVVNETPSVTETDAGAPVATGCTCTAEFVDPRCAAHQPQPE